VSLDEKPLIFLVLQADQGEAALQLLAVEDEVDMAFAQGFRHAFFRILAAEFLIKRVGALVPFLDQPRAVISFRYPALEVLVIIGMVFDLDGQTLVTGVRGRALGTAQLFRTPSCSMRKS